MIYNVVLVSGVQQSESFIHIFTLFWISFPFVSPQWIKQSSLCYTNDPVSACGLGKMGKRQVVGMKDGLLGMWDTVVKRALVTEKPSVDGESGGEQW